MPEKDISPEEKLLKLIRENKEQDREEIKILKKKKTKIRHNIDFRKLFSFFKCIHIKAFFCHGTRPILMCVIMLLFYFIWHQFQVDTTVNFTINKVKAEKEKIFEEAIKLKPYSYYETELGNKSLFSPIIIEKSTPVSKGSTENISEMCKTYRLKGIIMGERPEAFIEDTKFQRTSTVTIGDTIGNLTVMDIKEGRVVLGYEQESYELSF